MFSTVFSHVFRSPHKRHGWARVGAKRHVPNEANIEETRDSGARVGHRAKHPRREPGMSNGKNPIDPNRLTPEQAAKLLSAAAKIRVPVEQIREDLEAGAPRNTDGTINLMHYAAWMVKEMGRGN